MDGLKIASVPLVSVVMTVYNPDPEYFPKAVGSILRQTVEDLELIIIEDPSPRSGREMLGRIDDSRIRYTLNDRRTSLVAQRNQGLEAAEAELIAIMDSDDIAHPLRLEKQVDFLRAHPGIGVVGSQIAAIDSKDRIKGYRRFPVHHNEILDELPRIVPICNPSVMLRRDATLLAGGYRPIDYDAAEDYDLWSRMARLGVRFANHHETLLYYRIHNRQIKSSRLGDTIKSVLKIKELYWSDQMDIRARAQCLGERMLLLLPKWVVTRLMLASLYNDVSPNPNDQGNLVTLESLLRDDAWIDNSSSSSELPAPVPQCSRWRLIATRRF
jgi:glycosyltransferase involved in cell wall biosynthesis